MRTWEIAKLLLSNCDAGEDVNRLIEMLQDPAAIEQICLMLGPFAYPSAPGVNQVSTRPIRDDERTGSRGGSREKTSLRPRSSMNNNLLVASELAPMIRARGMTNKQAEQWFADSFGSPLKIGKDSLHKYISRVLNSADWRLRNQIISAINTLVADESKGTSEITQYWDELDKRFTVRND